MAVSMPTHGDTHIWRHPHLATPTPGDAHTWQRLHLATPKAVNSDFSLWCPLGGSRHMFDFDFGQLPGTGQYIYVSLENFYLRFLDFHWDEIQRCIILMHQGIKRNAKIMTMFFGKDQS